MTVTYHPYTARFEYEGRAFSFEHPNATDHIGRGHTAGKTFYERALLEELRRRLADRPGVIVDVGAHVGNHTVYFAGVMGRTVIAIEPNPIVLPALAKNVLFNDVADRVTILGCAAGKATWCRMGEDTPNNTGMQRVDFDKAGMRLVLGIDTVLWAEQVALLKIDVEGAETSVLESAHAMLTALPARGGQRPLVAMEAQTAEALAAQQATFERLGGDMVRYTPSEQSWGATPVHIWTSTDATCD